MTKYLSKAGWKPLDFRYWRVRDLLKNMGRCQIIQIHWPEVFWRSDNIAISMLKALFFVCIYFQAKLFGYKWVFFAHNVIPHYKVRSPGLERTMRLFILKHFDLVIGLASNTKNDLELAFGMSGKKYILAPLGIYDDIYPISINRETLCKEYSIPNDAKIIISLNAMARNNKGVGDLLSTWPKIVDYGRVHLLATGIKPDNYDELIENEHFHFIEGHISDKLFGSFLNAADFMFLNYKSITTSSMFTLALTFKLPLIAPNLPFFKLHSSEKTTLYFDYNYTLENQIDPIIDMINSGWQPDSGEFQKMLERHDNKKSIIIIARAFDELVQ